MELYVNDNFIGTKDVFAPQTIVLLDGTDIQNVQVPLGGTITFRNDDLRTYLINISGEIVQTLNYGDSVSYTGRTIGQVYYRDELAGLQRTIDVHDQLTTFNFTDVTTYMIDGQNDLKFIQKYPYPTFEQSQEFLRTASYSKFSNTIYLTNYTNTTDQRRVKFSGSVADSRYPLYYLLNIAPENVGNAGALVSIPLTGSLFNTTVSALREGENNIYFVTTDLANPNIFTGLQKVTVLVDTLAPDINIESVQYRPSGKTVDTILDDLETELYVNGQSMIINISTDATIMNYTFNNVTSTADVTNNSVSINLNLQTGLNPLVLTAVDVAGNINKQSHNIFFDDNKPELDPATLEPKELFKSSGKAHFFFQEIKGKLKNDKAGVQMTIFSIPEDATDYDGNRVTCAMYEKVFARNLGQLDREEPDSVELNIEEYQIALTSLMFQKVETTSGASGEFDALIGLQEKNFDRSDYNDANRNDEPERVDSVESRNDICFIMVDQFGNIGVDTRSLTLDAGNTMWRAGEITTIPNSIYSAEIAQTGDVRSGTGNMEFSMIVNFQYIGSGYVSKLTSISIKEDKAISEYSKYIKIDTSRMNYRLDKESGEMLVHVPVKIYPIKGLEAVDYPDKLDLGFKAYVKYSIGDKDVPIDEINPVYFQTSVNIERPLDHTKWLTPEMIDEWVGFLNKTIDFTQQAVDWTGKASVVGVLACTASKFWYGISTVSSSEAEKEEAKKTMFMICDRVACTASPQRCEGGFEDLTDGTNGVLKIDDGKISDQTQGTFSGAELEGEAQIVNNVEDAEVMAQFDTLKVSGTCDYNGKNDGVLVSGKVTKFVKSTGIWDYESKSQGYINKVCAPAQRDKSTGKITAINLQGASGVCYKEGAPKFDETRCNFFGSGGAPGWDPADNVIESIRCGCITDTYSHLKNYLQIMKSIRGCLQQAKIGEVKGSYCERLVGQAVCDIATNVLFKTITQKSSRGGSDGQDPHDNSILSGLQGLQEGDKILNDRYKGTFMGKSGMTSDAIVNKMCLGAISGDWSVLTDNILASVDQNEVEPIFGPMIPESRLQGYNPLTGDISIAYRFTHAAVSGGQNIKTEVEFICDSQAPGGDHCPDGYHTSKNPKMGSTFSLGTLYVRKGGSVQDSVVVKDTRARYRYNVIKLTHKYTVKGENKEKVVEENVFHKGEFMFGSCYFSAGALGAGSGFNCEALFTQDSLLSAYKLKDRYTKIVPNKGSTFYPKNSVYVDVHYDVKTDEENEQSSFDLAYVAICKGKGSGKAIKKSVVPVEVGRGSANSGNKVIELFKLPALGEDTADEKKVYSYTIKTDAEASVFNNKENEVFIRITNVDGTAGQDLKIEKGGLSDYVTGVGIGQNLVVNNGGTNLVKDVQVTKTSFDKEETLSVAFAGGQVKNIHVALVVEKANGPDKIEQMHPGSIDLDIEYEFDKLQSGTCSLEVRILPAGTGDAAIADYKKFKDYSPISEDIQVDSKQAGQDYKKMSFKVAKQTNKVASFAFIKPFEQDSICINPTATELPFEYLYQTSNNAAFDVQTLDIAISLERYAKTAKKTIVSLSQGKTKDTIDVSEIVSALAGKGHADAKLVYDLKTQYDKDSTKKDETKTIEFVIRVPEKGSNCEDRSPIFDQKEETPKVDGDAQDEQNQGDD